VPCVDVRRPTEFIGPSPDLVAVNHLSGANPEVASGLFEQLREDAIEFIEEVERVSVVPVSLIATRFDFRSIIDRREW